MTAEQYLGLLKTMPVAPWQEVVGARPLVVLSPHPDDESLGMGGLIALARRNHRDVSIVAVTDGAGSHPGSTTYPREKLVALRRAEMGEAARRLDVPNDRITHLNLPDTAAPKAGPAFDAAVTTVDGIVARAGAASLFVTWRDDPHCDHEAAALMAEEVRRRRPDIALWAYPVWGWHLKPTAEISAPSPRGYRVDVTEVAAAKRAAIAAHASQMTDLIADDPSGFRFDATTLAPFTGRYEYFIEVAA